MDNFDPYNVLLAIATNIPVLLMTAFVLQGHKHLAIHDKRTDSTMPFVHKWIVCIEGSWNTKLHFLRCLCCIEDNACIRNALQQTCKPWVKHLCAIPGLQHFRVNSRNAKTPLALNTKEDILKNEGNRAVFVSYYWSQWCPKTAWL